MNKYCIVNFLDIFDTQVYLVLMIPEQFIVVLSDGRKHMSNHKIVVITRDFPQTWYWNTSQTW